VTDGRADRQTHDDGSYSHLFKFPVFFARSGDVIVMRLSLWNLIQMAAWTKMSLGMELGLDPGDLVLDGDPVAPPQGGGGPPNFRPMFIVTKRLDG